MSKFRSNLALLLTATLLGACVATAQASVSESSSVSAVVSVPSAPLPPPPPPPAIGSLTTQSPPPPAPAPAPPPPPPPPLRYQALPDFAQGSAGSPKYPIDEQCRGIGGLVYLLVEIDNQGRALGATIERSSGSRNLDRAAVQAAPNWRFRPGMRDGVAIGGTVRVPINFTPFVGSDERCTWPLRVRWVALGKAATLQGMEDADRSLVFRAGETIHLLLKYLPVARASGTAQLTAIWRQTRFLGDKVKRSESRTVKIDGDRDLMELFQVPVGKDWPPGAYTVELLVDGHPLGGQTFEIVR